MGGGSTSTFGGFSSRLCGIASCARLARCSLFSLTDGFGSGARLARCVLLGLAGGGVSDGGRCLFLGG